jgi:hypothetical protein
MALRRRKLGLSRGCANAAQRVNDREVQVTREVSCLIEAACPVSRPVKRHRNYTGGIGEQVGASIAHERAQRSGQRSPAFVLQRVDDRSESAVVLADGPCAIDQPPDAATASTTGERNADGAPGGQRIAADVAQGRRQWEDRTPAIRADWTVRRRLEQLVARRATRCKDDRENGVERGLQAGAAGAFTRSAFPQSRSRP